MPSASVCASRFSSFTHPYSKSSSMLPMRLNLCDIQKPLTAPALPCSHSSRCQRVPERRSKACARRQRFRGQCHKTMLAASAVESPPSTSSTKKKRPLRVMIAGAPAAGKGTQCVKIVEKHGLVHVSAGDLLRAEVKAGTPAGKKAQQFMDNGNLVPNDVVVEMVVGRLQQDDAQSQGWLLDGYPRSAEQVQAIEEAGIRPDVFILINVQDDELVERVTGRRLDPETGTIYHMKFKKPPPEIVHRLTQRSDDTEEKLRNRLESHHRNVKDVIGSYTHELVEVDGSGSMEEVAKAIDMYLSEYEDRVRRESPAEQPDSIV